MLSKFCSMWFYEICKKDHPCDMYHYKKHVNDAFIKWDNNDFPVGNDEIEQIEEDNKHISVNVYYTNPDTGSAVKLFVYTKEATPHKHSIKLI